MLRSCVSQTAKLTASRGGRACAMMGGLALACAAGEGRTQIAQTPAATMIENVATLTLGEAPPGAVITSNRVALQVQEVLDVRVEVLTPEVEVEPDTHNQRLTFRIRNIGNGRQAFDLSLSVVDGAFDPHACRIIIDWDSDGLFDPTHDRETATTPVLDPGAAVVAWVSCGIPATAAVGQWGRVRLGAYPSVLRNGGTPTSPGESGVYVVLGTSLRSAPGPGSGTTGGGAGGANPTSPGSTATGTFRVGQASAQLVKTQSVVDRAGGARAMPGAVVTYSLEARFGAGATIRQAKISDTIPAGSTYVAGSLALDGVALSDAADSDAGRFSAEEIEVGLGDVTAAGRRVVTFKVRINPLESHP